MSKLHYKLFLTFILGLITVCQGYSQPLKADGIRTLITDMSASIYSRNDNNGNACGLVKVEFAKPGAAFEGNVIGSTEYKAGEYWVYLSPGSKFLKVKHAEYTPVVLQFDGSTVGAVESKKVYAVKISAGAGAQEVTFKITPHDAVLTVDQKEYATSNGVARIMLSPEEHSYVVVAPGYNVQGSRFMVYENNTNKIIVELEPKSGVSPVVVSSQSSQVSQRNEINGHEYVDLGLPSGLKWATMNVGATSPSDYGSYFAWGETQPKAEYTESNSRTWKQNYGDIGGNAEFDASRANWGGSWRLPTKAEYEELINKCTWTYIIIGNHKGYKVVGPNGNHIFLPAAGFRDGSSLYNAGERGHYWTSSPGSSSQNGYGLYFYFYGSSRGMNDSYRYRGRSVRPVSE